MKNFKELRDIFEQINALARKADRFNAQRRAQAEQDGAKAGAIWKAYTEQATRDEENATRAKALCLNAAYYITTEVLPAAAEIWNGYEGKRIGDKTREKIRIEARELANAARLDYVIFYDDHITTRFSYRREIYYNFDGKPDGSGAAYFEIDYYTDGNGERLNLYDESGRAAKINLNGVKKYSDFITDIDAFIKQANEARELIKQKKQELKDAQHAAAIYSDIFDPWNI
jgi:hypothetical protein